MNNLISYLINYGFGRGISSTLTEELPPDFPSSASSKYQKVLINMNWRNKWEVPFSFAHELGHIMNRDTGIRYYESETVKDKSEYQANLFGIRLLLQFCKRNGFAFDNSVKFCEVFGIPIELEYIVNLKLKEIM